MHASLITALFDGDLVSMARSAHWHRPAAAFAPTSARRAASALSRTAATGLAVGLAEPIRASCPNPTTEVSGCKASVDAYATAAEGCQCFTDAVLCPGPPTEAFDTDVDCPSAACASAACETEDDCAGADSARPIGARPVLGRLIAGRRT